jgi:hypothetical protein
MLSNLRCVWYKHLARVVKACARLKIYGAREEKYGALENLWRARENCCGARKIIFVQKNPDNDVPAAVSDLWICFSSCFCSLISVSLVCSTNHLDLDLQSAILVLNLIEFSVPVCFAFHLIGLLMRLKQTKVSPQGFIVFRGLHRRWAASRLDKSSRGV